MLRYRFIVGGLERVVMWWGCIVRQGRGSTGFLVCSQRKRQRRQGVAVDRIGGDKQGKRKRKAPALRVVAESDRVVPLIRGQGKSADGLTVKQEAFAASVASGATLAASYRSAYDCEAMSAGAIHTEASKLMCNPAIARRINALVDERKVKTSHDAARIRQHVIERLHVEATDPDNPPAVRVRSLELLGKLDVVGMFKDRAAAEPAEPTAGDITATLEARLKALLTKTG